MDEGRNVCLVFPELIDLAGTDGEQLTRCKAFEVKSVNPLCFQNIILHCLLTGIQPSYLLQQTCR